MANRLPLALLIAALALPAFAQSHQGSSPAGQGGFLIEMPEGGMRASKLLGTDVVGLDINKVGDIDDIVLDRDGTPVAAVVSVGGFLGMGAKQVAIPFADLMWNYDASPTSGPSASNTGQATRDGTMQTQSAVATPVGPTPPETTGTVGDPSRPREGLDVGKVATPVSGKGEPVRATVRLTRDDLRDAPEFQAKR
jgi:sporulation protein YlmC with PRC-barrel domain